MQLYVLLGMSASEKWSTGGITTLIGLGMTFVMLVLLICAIHLLRLILKGLDKTLPIFKSKITQVFSRKKKSDVSSEQNTTHNETVTETIDAETLSVIEESVKRYVAESADDGKPHKTIKILSVKEVINE